MALTVIKGPMMSCKSQELITRTKPLSIAGWDVLYVQHKEHTRDGEGIKPRNFERSIPAITVVSLAEVTIDFDAVAVDEAHMFNAEDVLHVDDWLSRGKEVFMSGLDLDYARRVPPFIFALTQLVPDTEVCLQAVCECCSNINAQFTQILENGEPITSGLPSKVPEDGTYTYEPRCRDCHTWDREFSLAPTQEYERLIKNTAA